MTVETHGETARRHNSSFSGEDLRLFTEGAHIRIFDHLGAHLTSLNGIEGAHFAVWAPKAERVSVVGDFNNWDPLADPLVRFENSGIWSAFIPRVREAAPYQYHILARQSDGGVKKADPVGFYHEVAPRTGSLVWDLQYEWHDQEWMRARAERNKLTSPLSIYQVHLGSWMRVPEEGNRFLTYRELALKLGEYLERLGFKHAEFLPVMEHPCYDSSGYQTTGYFAPTSRYGTPQDLMYLIDRLHQQNIGVILAWVPSHFAPDENGLALFDGTHLYEQPEARLGSGPNRNQCAFEYARPQVRSFLLSSAIFWLEKYHADGLRMGAISSMLDDRRAMEGDLPDWFSEQAHSPAIDFVRHCNREIYGCFPDVQAIASESNAWPMVSRPVHAGGLGFGLKWDTEFARVTRRYFSEDPLFRKHHHNELIGRASYAFSENLILPFSHDLVVDGQGSLLSQMPGDHWQKFANLRLLFGYMYLQPGKKLLFMGDEFGQWREWNHNESLDWHLVRSSPHQGLQRWLTDLNQRYRRAPALHQNDAEPSGFEWIDCHDAEQSTLSWLRGCSSRDEIFVVVCNFTPVVRNNYRIGAVRGGYWLEVLNSDAKEYGGSGQGNFGRIEAAPLRWHDRPYTLTITLPPLAAVVFMSPGDAR